MAELVGLKISGELGILIINNPPFNALRFGVFQELQNKFEELKKNEQVKAIIIASQGAVFSAGADVTEIYQLARSKDRQKAEQAIKELHQILLALENSSKPVIAAINGICLGGGLELALACHYRLAGKQTKFGFPEINLGLIPGLGGTQRLPRRTGVKNAMRLLIGGKEKMIDAVAAKDIGLIDEIADGELNPAVKKFALEIINAPAGHKTSADQELDSSDFKDNQLFEAAKNKSLFATNTLLKVVREGMNKSLLEALEIETLGFLDCLFNGDGLEGLAAFIEKRTPRFKEAVGVEKKAEEQKNTEGEKKIIWQPPCKNEDYVSLRELVRDFAKKRIKPFIAKMEKEERVPPELIKEMAELGFYGVYFSEQYGGANMGKTGYCILMEELSRVHGSTAVTVGVQVGLACNAVNLFGNEAQKEKYLRAGIAGKLIGAFALTEAEAGSAVASISTSAEKKGNKWIINGGKQFITNGDIADFFIVFTQINKQLGQKGITAFIVEKSSPGFSIGKIEDKMGIRASRTTSLIFDNVEVPEENLLGSEGQGFKMAMTILNMGRLSLAAGCLGTAKEALDLALKYASQRRQGDKILLEYQMIQGYLGRMGADVDLMENAIYHVAALADAGYDIRRQAASLKLRCSELTEKVIDLALQIHGGYGYIKEYDIERLYRDSRINRIFEGTNEIQILLVAKELIKEMF